MPAHMLEQLMEHLEFTLLIQLQSKVMEVVLTLIQGLDHGMWLELQVRKM